MTKRIRVEHKVRDNTYPWWEEDSGFEINQFGEVVSVEVLEPVRRTRLTLDAIDTVPHLLHGDVTVQPAESAAVPSQWTVVSCEQIESYE